MQPTLKDRRRSNPPLPCPSVRPSVLAHIEENALADMRNREIRFVHFETRNVAASIQFNRVWYKERKEEEKKKRRRRERRSHSGNR
jgi:hypothetical protein